MLVHSLVINYNKDIRPAVFTLGRRWDINTRRQLDTIIRHLTKRTLNDKRGRVLCIGKPQIRFASNIVRTPADEQDRVYIVKMGHDNILWNRYYPMYVDAVNTIRTK